MAAPTECQGKRFINVFESDAVVAEKLCNFVISKANEAISDRGLFTVGFSGGSLSKYLCNGLPKGNTDWSKWRVFFCDERHVPYNDKECTYTFYKENLMNQVPLEHVYPDTSEIPVSEAAELYSKKIKEVFAGQDLPQFDMLLLGMGPDGHTCSLFPGHPLLEEKSLLVAAISDSPKPPPERITLTYPVINNTRCAVFVSCGSGKAEMVQRILEGTEDPPLPAARVKPTQGELHWFLDQGAGRLLKTKSSM